MAFLAANLSELGTKQKLRKFKFSRPTVWPAEMHITQDQRVPEHTPSLTKGRDS